MDSISLMWRMTLTILENMVVSKPETSEVFTRNERFTMTTASLFIITLSVGNAIGMAALAKEVILGMENAQTLEKVIRVLLCIPLFAFALFGLAIGVMAMVDPA